VGERHTDRDGLLGVAELSDLVPDLATRLTKNFWELTQQAKKLIVQKLASTIYSDIRRGHTSVDVTLGSIRSIKVSIIGEATVPGTYTLPSLATAYNALYACGGPNLTGSYRNIQVIRNNATVAVIDVYQYLTTGSKKSDVRLMERSFRPWRTKASTSLRRVSG